MSLQCISDTSFGFISYISKHNFLNVPEDEASFIIERRLWPMPLTMNITYDQGHLQWMSLITNVTDDKMSLMTQCHLCQNVTYDKMSLMPKCHLCQNVTYAKMSLMPKCHLWQNVTYDKMSLMTKCHLWQNVNYNVSSFMANVTYDETSITI